MTRENGQTRGGTGPRRETKSRAQVAKTEQPVAEVGNGHQRIAKLMARAGLCSRRDAEAWILDGRVSVNDAVLTSPARDVGPTDVVLVDGRPLPAADKTRLFLFHKPGGLITTDHDPEGRETVFDYLREHWPDGPRVVTIGRLDFNTEGLLLLTNDGGLARVLELPKTGWVRRYRVRAKGTTDQGVLDRLAHGVTIEGIEYAGIEAKLDRIQGANCWLTMGLREGKNREVKRVLDHIGLDVNRLIRLSFGPFQLLDLPEGHVEEVKTRILREQLGPSLAKAAGVDFEEAEAAAAIVATPQTGTLKAVARDGRKARAPQASPLKGAQAAPRGRTFRDRDGDRDTPVAAPEIREKPIAGPRKHVSTLRAQSGTALRTGPRTKLERTDTTDRKDRIVAVERRVFTAPVVETRTRGRERGNDQPQQREHLDSPVRRERSESPARRERSESPARRERSESPARRERPTASPKRSFGEERASQSALGKRERVARSGGATEDTRAVRPARTVGRDTDDSPRTRPPRTAGKTFGERPNGGRPATGRVNDRGGDKPGRSRSSSSEKPGSERPGRERTAGEHTAGKHTGAGRPVRGRSADGEKRPPRAGRGAPATQGRPARSGPPGDRPRPPRKPRG